MSAEVWSSKFQEGGESGRISLEGALDGGIQSMRPSSA
jgi:hypothetical protein